MRHRRFSRISIVVNYVIEPLALTLISLIYLCLLAWIVNHWLPHAGTWAFLGCFFLTQLLTYTTVLIFLRYQVTKRHEGK